MKGPDHGSAPGWGSELQTGGRELQEVAGQQVMTEGRGRGKPTGGRDASYEQQRATR